jgi:hypothetical protein
MTEAGPEDGKTRPEEVAARKHKLQELAYLLDLARLEAAERSRRAPGSEAQRIA